MQSSRHSTSHKEALSHPTTEPLPTEEWHEFAEEQST
jgi:hypothetical protein